MKKNRTIGKTVVMDAARARGLRVVRMVDPEDGRRKWRIDDYKGLAIWLDSLVQVWMVVQPRPKIAISYQPSAISSEEDPSPLTPLPVVEGNQMEEDGV